MSNVIPLFPPELSTKEIYPVVDELADAMLKTHGLDKGGLHLTAVKQIADEIVKRNGSDLLLGSPEFDFGALHNFVLLRLVTRILQLNTLTDFYELARIAAIYGFLPCEDRGDA